MKPEIHPEYHVSKVHCACGNEFETRATVAELKLDICAVCHPFYTGKQKFVDTAGRVQRFEDRYANFRKQRNAQKADQKTDEKAETSA